MLTVNELFAGIGSQRAALERLGIEHEVVGIAEIDKFAIKSYEAIWGETKNYGDISKAEKLDYADFWTYSFPCQDISVAGKQAGINKHTRSGLLYEVERLLEKSKECGELPKYLMLENVKNLVGKKFKPKFEEWIIRLDELGYNTKWQILNSKHYGIPQNRERVFAISIRKDIDMGYVFPEPFDNGKRLKDILEKEVDEKYYLNGSKAMLLIQKLKDDGQLNNPIETVDGGINKPKAKDISNCIKARYDCGISNQRSDGTMVVENILIGGMQKNQAVKTDGISTCLTSSMGTGGGYVPMVTEPIIAASRGRNPNNPSDRTAGSPTEQRLEINQNGTSNTITTVQKDNYVLIPQATKKGYIECNVPRVADLSFPDSKTRRGRVQESGEIVPTLMAGQQDVCYIEPQIQKVDIPQTVTVRKHEVDRNLLCECLRDYKSVSNFSNKEIAERLDRPITLVEHWFRRDKSFSIPDADIWYELKRLLKIETDEFDLPITEFIQQEGVYEKANRCYMVDGISPTITSTSADEKIIEDYRIRKLTPKECWRLMGFTDEQFQKAQDAGVSNSQLYKQAGNSICVDVLYYLFKNLFL